MKLTSLPAVATPLRSAPSFRQGQKKHCPCRNSGCTLSRAPLGRTHASRPPSIPRRSTMAKYLISFPSAATVVPDGEWGAVGRDAHAVIDEAKAAGVYVFGGGIDEDVPPVLVSADGTVAMGGYPWAPTLDGGFTVVELPSRDDAIAWAARIAQACP